MPPQSPTSPAPLSAAAMRKAIVTAHPRLVASRSPCPPLLDSMASEPDHY